MWRWPSHFYSFLVIVSRRDQFRQNRPICGIWKISESIPASYQEFSDLYAPVTSVFAEPPIERLRISPLRGYNGSSLSTPAIRCKPTPSRGQASPPPGHGYDARTPPGVHHDVTVQHGHDTVIRIRRSGGVKRQTAVLCERGWMPIASIPASRRASTTAAFSRRPQRGCGSPRQLSAEPSSTR